jgi:hypothetical protein
MGMFQITTGQQSPGATVHAGGIFHGFGGEKDGGFGIGWVDTDTHIGELCTLAVDMVMQRGYRKGLGASF